MRRHWRGELSLPRSYWINGVLLTFGFTAAVRIIPCDWIVGAAPRLYSAAVIGLWFLIAATSLWQLVGIWSSAGTFLREGRSRVWGNAARIATILCSLGTVVNFATAGIPQVAEYVKIVAGRDQAATYQVRVLRDATEIEIAGYIGFGLTKEVRRTLDANPKVRLVHLNSSGGRVVEARALRDLIDSRKLSTYTSSGCASACTLAYAAGQKRLIASNAQLGFHQYSFPGLKESAFQGEYEKDKRDWLSRGFARDFVDRAFATPSNRLWKPSHEELFEWGVVTGYPESADVAVSGFRPGQIETVEADVAKIPLYAALKMCEPGVYEQLLSEFRSGVQQGRSMEELREKTLPLLKSVYRKRLPYGSDSALRSFAGLLLEQMKVLCSVDPALCYDYLWDEDHGADVTRYFSRELIEKESAVMTEVIRSASEGTNQPPGRRQVEGQLQRVFASLAGRYGDDVGMLVDRERGKAHKARTCELTCEFYREILSLPEQDSGPLLRFIFAGLKA